MEGAFSWQNLFSHPLLCLSDYKNPTWMTCQSIDEKGGQQYLAHFSKTLILQFHKYQSLLTLTIKVDQSPDWRNWAKRIFNRKGEPFEVQSLLDSANKIHFSKKKVPQVVCVTKGNHQDQRRLERAFSKVPFTTIF